MLKKCAGPCRPHAFQDAKYGEGIRVHNRAKQSSAPKDQTWRCTVCGQPKRNK